MVTEKTPKYIIDLEENLGKRVVDLEESLSKQIVDLGKSVGRQISEIRNEVKETNKLVDDLAIMTKEGFDRVESNIGGIRDDVSQLKYDVENLKISVEKIEGHIGRYEIRTQNIESILLEDHKPRIADLEKVVFKIK